MKATRIFFLLLTGIILTYFTGKILRDLLVDQDRNQFATEHVLISYKGVYDDEAEDIGKVLDENYGF